MTASLTRDQLAHKSLALTFELAAASEDRRQVERVIRGALAAVPAGQRGVFLALTLTELTVRVLEPAIVDATVATGTDKRGRYQRLAATAAQLLDEGGAS